MNALIKLKFTKMHSLGNDFMILNAVQSPLPDDLTPDKIQKLADRHRGVGFDQLFVIHPSQGEGSDFSCHIYNTDGSQALHCGNGFRCVARFLARERLTQKTCIRLTIHGTSTPKKVELELHSDKQVTVDMGGPVLDASEIPFLPEAMTVEDREQYHIAEHQVIGFGNPHVVILTEAPLDTVGVQEIGTMVQHLPCFPQQVNVGFMQIQDRKHIRLRVCERGVGETLACGSGACAAAIVGYRLNRLDAEVQVALPGGVVNVSYDRLKDSVYLKGPATFVFDGTLHFT